ncbi:MAG: histidinol dehydrogenase [Cyclobacteriaceae bacterium]|nr:histidinol dehydrogenase [Cyclobacteriaceae bacterium]
MEKYINPDRASWPEITKRPEVDNSDLRGIVEGVFADVRADGDKALRKYTTKFDKVELEHFEASESEVEEAINRVSSELKAAIELAANNIKKFHASQKLEVKKVETVAGVTCWQEARPIEKVGIYIPGGTAPLFSTVLMLAIPAKIAGCKEIILCTPPNREGTVADEILYAANLTGVDRIFKVGGIQAIAAFSFGTESISRVDKIFGPGNQYVTAAKQLATQYGLAIDMPAGPSELLVMSDKTGNPAFIASDLLSQAEHGADSQVIFVTNDQSMLAKVEAEVALQIEELPRKEIAKLAIENSRLVCFTSDQDILDFINAYGPEHFILNAENGDYYLKNLISAGSVFIGSYTPESAGDYASGTNHTLPTNGYAKAYSGVNLDSFTKKITFQKITPEGIRSIGPAIELMAEAEGLQAHKNAVTLRLAELNK